MQVTTAYLIQDSFENRSLQLKSKNWLYELIQFDKASEAQNKAIRAYSGN